MRAQAKEKRNTQDEKDLLMTPPEQAVEHAIDENAYSKEREKATTRRLSLNLAPDVYSELNNLARLRGTSMTDVVRLGLGLARIAIQEAKRGNKLVVTTDDNKSIKEIVLP